MSILRCEHEGPEKREAEGDLTADENAGDVVVGTETTVMGFKDGGQATGPGPQVAAGCCEMQGKVPLSEPPEGTILTDALMLAP